MTLRKSFALLLIAATVAGCASPQMVTRTSGIDLVSATAIVGMYR